MPRLLTTISAVLKRPFLLCLQVAVLGVGGLGHLALQIANKWGCEVTALSRDASKKQSILALGAHHFVDTKADPE